MKLWKIHKKVYKNKKNVLKSTARYGNMASLVVIKPNLAVFLRFGGEKTMILWRVSK